MGESFKVFGLDWFHIHFTENPGMAFGLELGGDYGKLILTSFRIVVVCFIAYYLGQLIKRKASFLLLACISLIFAGAVGNIIDSVFYGLIFSDSGSFHAPEVATFMPAEGGYASVLHGKVVDMLYFPIYEGFLPEWVPMMGGQYFVFFQPIFNIADTSISCGVGLALLFYKRFQAEIEPPAKFVESRVIHESEEPANNEEVKDSENTNKSDVIDTNDTIADNSNTDKNTNSTEL